MTILFFQINSTRKFRLKITAGQRKMSDQNGALTGQKLHSPVMLIGAFLLNFRTEQVHREKVFFLDFMEPRSNQWMCALLGKHFTYITKTAKNLAGRMCKQLCFFFSSTKQTKKQTNREKIRNVLTWCPNPTRNSAKLIHTAALQPTMTKTSLYHCKRATCTSPFLLDVERMYRM